MHRYIASLANKLPSQPCQLHNHLVLRRNQAGHILRPPCQVFINHRGTDTKRNVAGLIYHYLALHGLHPFLDSQTMRPGEKLHDRINDAIHECRVGITLFSPRYCESPYCLHELALLTETGKRLVPIFCDVQPSKLRVLDFSGRWPEKQSKRFGLALEEARSTVGLTFNTATGDWSKLLRDTLEAVMRTVYELDQEQDHGWPNHSPPYYTATTEAISISS
ncbi:hypothetical protein MLD38_039871 [Melastoma candidum]|uniref:Uncharacterized protein n=1 Tax=Melastoma candidum TaxID=119954 RepID=A0ACB9L4L7_9MYRT|nr:hypothetical protein MLD38_039871 [Melastoma candidum]